MRSCTSFIGTVEDKVSFISETSSCPLNVPDSSREMNNSFDRIPSCTLSDSLPVQTVVDDNNRTTSEQMISQNTIIFGDENKSDNLTLQQSDLLLLQILETLQNENDCVSAATAPPTIATLTTGIIYTSCNEIIVENRVDSNKTSAQGLSDKSNSVPLGRVGADSCLKGYFCLDVVSNLSHRVLSELEIEVSGKGSGFSPTPSFINKADLKRDFVDFSRKMRCKWYFRNDISENFSETPAFRTKSTWNPPQGHPALEIFLSQMEADVFSLLPGNTAQYNLSKEE